jgi:hypothetical protein
LKITAWTWKSVEIWSGMRLNAPGLRQPMTQEAAPAQIWRRENFLT